jgi:hypothetical protein
VKRWDPHEKWLASKGPVCCHTCQPTHNYPHKCIPQLWMKTRVKMMMSWALKGHRPGGKAKSPGFMSSRVSQGKHPSFFLVQVSGVSLPLVGVTTSICWDFIPMEVRANHSPICTYPPGKFLQQQKVCPPGFHKSEGS